MPVKIQILKMLFEPAFTSLPVSLLMNKLNKVLETVYIIFILESYF